MKRKQFIQNLAFVGGGLLLMPTALLNSCKKKVRIRITLTENRILLLDEIGETFIPTTKKSEGARATKIGSYMLTMFNDCFNSDDQVLFLDGLEAIDELSLDIYNANFLNLKISQRLEILKRLYSKEKLCFFMFKNLSINGYFTSKIGATKARRYEQIPGRYEACIEYKDGDRAWTGVY